MFPQLTVLPGSLLLAPGCKTSIRLVGGPSQRSRRIYGLRLNSTLDRSDHVLIDSIDGDFFLIETLKVGQAVVSFNYFRGEQAIVGVKLPITVA